LVTPTNGLAQIGGFDSEQAATGGGGRLVAYAGGAQTFHGTLRENVDLGRQGIGQSRVREVLQQVGLAPTVLKLPDALSTHLQTDGYPFSSIQVCQLVLARAMAGKPKVLVIDGLLDPLDDDVRSSLWESLAAADAPWTLIVATNRREIAQECDSQIAVRKL
jgi:putative ABC transport system ATP-binding protein